MDFKKLLIKNYISIKEAMKTLDLLGSQFLVVVKDNNELVGSLTDGDIRRGLLNNISLDDRIDKVCNLNPIVLNNQFNSAEIKNKAKQKQVSQLILINSCNQVIGVESTKTVKQKKKNAVVLMVGGLGTRLRPLTDKTPKPLLNVGDKPILEIIIKKFVDSGFQKFYLSVNYKAEMIKNYFQDGSHLGVEIEYLEEKDRLGTAGALSLLNSKNIVEPFFVMNGDLLTNINFQKLLDFHLEQKSIATVGVREYDFQVPYGVLKTKNGFVSKIEEKPVHSFFVSSGIYLLEPEILPLVPKDKFYDMPTLLTELINQSHRISSFPIHEYWLDIGRINEYHQANAEYKDIFE
ncbi:alcohol dehydrogenase [Paraphotobacterium marinum]|uniref:Alcohol dehydrogenase n=1 Tax=Paraphotobacterium marinum TaxID=1755811 RepID=A0A220VCV6_9GAMM|nr:nucleotidyltransferase family protein [Paraphotobacterium marinum]ASK78111.1 alcohol dehydrogenase [Paraphotobacterium marinum]